MLSRLHRAAFAALTLALLAACGAAPKPLTYAGPTTHLTSPGHCHARAAGQLPDPTCTPGALNAAVTQSTIGRTICKPGWATSVRPPLYVSEAMKRDVMTAYGYAGQPLAWFESDHLVPLEMGGDPGSVSNELNIWPEPNPLGPKAVPATTNPKDRVENAARKAVCTGQMSLADARSRIVSDWRALGRRLHVL